MGTGCLIHLAIEQFQPKEEAGQNQVDQAEAYGLIILSI